MKTRSFYTKIFILLMLYGGVLFVYLCVNMPGDTLTTSLPSLTEEQLLLSERLEKHVRQLAEEIGERHYGKSQAYNDAADYIAQSFQDNGLVPYEEAFGDKLQYRNIIAEHYGSKLTDEIIVIGAHYDTVWSSPGADDNASGVAVMLELARLLKLNSYPRTIRFVAFANEEYPKFLTKDMGSLFHAKQSYERGENILGMISLEMLGYYSDDPNSQNYPSPFSWFYPDTANFVAFVSNFKSRKMLRESIRVFRDEKVFPSEGLTVPVAFVPDVRRSDHAAFWQYNYPAFMLTDTAAFRNYAYHNAGDVPNTLNYTHMARVTTGMVQVIEQLAGIKNK